MTRREIANQVRVDGCRHAAAQIALTDAERVSIICQAESVARAIEAAGTAGAAWVLYSRWNSGTITYNLAFGRSPKAA